MENVNIKWHQLHKVTVRIKGDDGHIALSKGAQYVLSTSHPRIVTVTGSNLTANPSKITEHCFSEIKKKMTFWYLWQHEWTWGYYAKPNKSDRKRDIPYDVTHMWNMKTYIHKQAKTNRTEYWLPKEKGPGRKNWWKRSSVQWQTETKFWCEYGVVDTNDKTQRCTHETY